DQAVEALFRPAKLLFHRTPFGQVAGYLGKSGEVALLVAQRRDHDVRPKTRAVFANAPALLFATTLAAHRFVNALGRARVAVFGCVKEREVMSDDLVCLVAFDSLGASIPSSHLAGWVETKNRIIGNRVDQRVELFVARALELVPGPKRLWSVCFFCL